MPPKSVKNMLGLGAVCLLAMGTTVMAQPNSHMDHQSSTATRMGWYVDFAATTIAGHSAEPIVNLGGANVKAHLLQVTANGYTGPACYDLSTTHPDYIPAATADTRIWFLNVNTGNYSVLNDDWNGTTFSTGRIFLNGSNAFVNLRVAAYSSFWNTAHFKIYLTRNNTAEATCTTGSGKKWVKYVNGVMSNG